MAANEDMILFCWKPMIAIEACYCPYNYFWIGLLRRDTTGENSAFSLSEILGLFFSSILYMLFLGPQRLVKVTQISFSSHTGGHSWPRAYWWIRGLMRQMDFTYIVVAFFKVLCKWIYSGGHSRLGANWWTCGSHIPPLAFLQTPPKKAPPYSSHSYKEGEWSCPWTQRQHDLAGVDLKPSRLELLNLKLNVNEVKEPKISKWIMHGEISFCL